jgi:hypothetical protein
VGNEKFEIMLLEKAIRAVCGNKQKNAGQKEMRVREPGVRIQDSGGRMGRDYSTGANGEHRGEIERGTSNAGRRIRPEDWPQKSTENAKDKRRKRERKIDRRWTRSVNPIRNTQKNSKKHCKTKLNSSLLARIFHYFSSLSLAK